MEWLYEDAKSFNIDFSISRYYLYYHKNDFEVDWKSFPENVKIEFKVSTFESKTLI
jgi:hypothetical protein